jgi:hypothetical protein
MTSDVFVPGDEHREGIIELMRVAYNLSPASVPERTAWLPVEKCDA